MTRTWRWLSLSLAAAVVVAGASFISRQVHQSSARAREFAALPDRERNLAVFDAACAALRSHYYDPSFFRTARWQALEGEWRARAAGIHPALLYPNVLDNFASQFPESHVGFARPPAPRTASQSIAAGQRIPDYVYERAGSGPGFDTSVIRRPLGRLEVVADVLRNSPAERAGVAPGWFVLKEGHITLTPDGAHFSAEFLQLDPEQSLAAENTGQIWVPAAVSQQQLTDFIAAHTTPVEFELEKLPVAATFETRRTAADITYLRFDGFDSFERISAVLTSINFAARGGLILDLRHNTGGSGLNLRRVAGALLGHGIVLGTQRAARWNTSMTAWRFGTHYTGPLVVLIGPRSASAAEILAAAIHDQRRGTLIGRVTQGAAIAAQWFDLPDGGRIMVPTSDFVRADGQRIEARGVEPDIRVLPTLDDIRAGRDPAVERAGAQLSHH